MWRGFHHLLQHYRQVCCKLHSSIVNIIYLYRHSFNEAVEYRSLITKVRASEDVPVILVANKVDLEQTNRAVDVREGEALADKFNCPFYETSAAHRRHVDDVFHSLVREIRQVEHNHHTFICFEGFP